MLVAISTDFKDSAWSFSSLLKIHISADLHTIRDHIVVSDRPVLRRRERKGARTWPSFVKTRPQREYLYTTLEMAVEEQRGRGIIRFYEATMYFASRVTLEILRPPFNSLVQRISLAIVPRFRGRTFRRVCPFLFHVRAKRSENSVRGVWSLLLNFNTTGGEGTGVVMKFPPTLFSHQQNKYFPSYERQQFNLVAGGEEAGNWFLGHGTFRDTTHSRRNNERASEWMSECERERKRERANIPGESWSRINIYINGWFTRSRDVAKLAYPPFTVSLFNAIILLFFSIPFPFSSFR